MRAVPIVIPAFLLTVLAVAAAAQEGAERSGFDRAADAAVLDLAAPSVREDLAAALEDAGTNWTELARGIGELSGEERDAAIWLVNGAPHLDRLEMTAETLVEHVRYAFRARDEMPYDVPDDKFRPYILTYRIEEEPVDPWRKELYERYGPVASAAGSVREAARAVNLDLAGRLTEREREFFGPTQAPLLTLRSGSGTEAEIAILACAVMKAIGIPSREASVRALGEEPEGASWVEIFDGESWVPLYPLEPEAFGDFGWIERGHPRNVTVVATRSAFESVLVTEEYTDTGVVEFSFVADGREAAGYEHFSANVLNRGALVPLDDLEAVADDDGRFEAILGDGRYVLLAGVRDPNGDPFVRMREIEVEPGERYIVAFDVTPGEHDEGLDPAQAREMGKVIEAVVLFDLSREPDVRMLPLIAGALSRRSANVVAEYVSVGTPPVGAPRVEEILPAGSARAELGPGESSYTTADGRAVAVPGGPEGLPLVALFDRRTGALILTHTGYDLNIDRRLSDAIDAHLREPAAR
jgi:hypothetical protein